MSFIQSTTNILAKMLEVIKVSELVCSEPEMGCDLLVSQGLQLGSNSDASESIAPGVVVLHKGDPRNGMIATDKDRQAQQKVGSATGPSISSATESQSIQERQPPKTDEEILQSYREPLTVKLTKQWSVCPIGEDWNAMQETDHYVEFVYKFNRTTHHFIDGQVADLNMECGLLSPPKPDSLLMHEAYMLASLQKSWCSKRRDLRAKIAHLLSIDEPSKRHLDQALDLIEELAKYRSYPFAQLYGVDFDSRGCIRGLILQRVQNVMSGRWAVNLCQTLRGKVQLFDMCHLLLSAVSTMHSLGVAHLDIKCQNVGAGAAVFTPMSTSVDEQSIYEREWKYRRSYIPAVGISSNIVKIFDFGSAVELDMPVASNRDNAVPTFGKTNHGYLFNAGAAKTTRLFKPIESRIDELDIIGDPIKFDLYAVGLVAGSIATLSDGWFEDSDPQSCPIDFLSGHLLESCSLDNYPSLALSKLVRKDGAFGEFADTVLMKRFKKSGFTSFWSSQGRCSLCADQNEQTVHTDIQSLIHSFESPSSYVEDGKDHVAGLMLREVESRFVGPSAMTDPLAVIDCPYCEFKSRQNAYTKGQDAKVKHQASGDEPLSSLPSLRLKMLEFLLVFNVTATSFRKPFIKALCGGSESSIDRHLPLMATAVTPAQFAHCKTSEATTSSTPPKSEFEMPGVLTDMLIIAKSILSRQISPLLSFVTAKYGSTYSVEKVWKWASCKLLFHGLRDDNLIPEFTAGVDSAEDDSTGWIHDSSVPPMSNFVWRWPCSTRVVRTLMSRRYKRSINLWLEKFESSMSDPIQREVFFPDLSITLFTNMSSLIQRVTDRIKMLPASRLDSCRTFVSDKRTIVQEWNTQPLYNKYGILDLPNEPMNVEFEHGVSAATATSAGVDHMRARLGILHWLICHVFGREASSDALPGLHPDDARLFKAFMSLNVAQKQMTHVRKVFGIHVNDMHRNGICSIWLASLDSVKMQMEREIEHIHKDEVPVALRCVFDIIHLTCWAEMHAARVGFDLQGHFPHDEVSWIAISKLFTSLFLNHFNLDVGLAKEGPEGLDSIIMFKNHGLSFPDWYDVASSVLFTFGNQSKSSKPSHSVNDSTGSSPMALNQVSKLNRLIASIIDACRRDVGTTRDLARVEFDNGDIYNSDAWFSDYLNEKHESCSDFGLAAGAKTDVDSEEVEIVKIEDSLDPLLKDRIEGEPTSSSEDEEEEWEEGQEQEDDDEEDNEDASSDEEEEDAEDSNEEEEEYDDDDEETDEEEEYEEEEDEEDEEEELDGDDVADTTTRMTRDLSLIDTSIIRSWYGVYKVCFGAIAAYAINDWERRPHEAILRGSPAVWKRFIESSKFIPNFGPAWHCIMFQLSIQQSSIIAPPLWTTFVPATIISMGFRGMQEKGSKSTASLNLWLSMAKMKPLAAIATVLCETEQLLLVPYEGVIDADTQCDVELLCRRTFGSSAYDYLIEHQSASPDDVDNMLDRDKKTLTQLRECCEYFDIVSRVLLQSPLGTMLRIPFLTA